MDELPATLSLALKPELELGGILAIAETDLLLDGSFGEEWLVLTAGRLRVFSAPAGAGAPAPTARLDLPTTDLARPQIEALIGGGALMADIKGRSFEILRFSNAQQRKFGRLGKYLADDYAYREAVAKNKTPLPDPAVLTEDTAERTRCPACRLLLPEGTRVCPACLNKGKVILRLFGYLKPYWRETLTVWTMMGLGLILSLVPPYLTRPLMDKVLVPAAGTAASMPERMHWLGWMVLALLGSQILGQLVGIVRSRTLIVLGTRLSHDMRVQLYAHLQFLSLRFFEKRSVGAMITRVTQDTQSLESVLVDGMQYFVVNVLTLLGIGTVLFLMNWRLALLVLLPVPVVIVLSRVFWNHIISLWNRFWHTRSRLTSSVSDSLSGTRVVKAFARENDEIERFRSHSQAVLNADTAAEQTWATFFPLLWFIASTGSLMVWYVGGQQVLGGNMTLGTLMTFLAYLGMFYGPLQFLSRIADYLARSLTSAERVFEILDSETDVAEAVDAIPLPVIQGHVEFCGVSFGYEAHKPVLKNVAMDIKPGEMIGLVGHSGSGKSTTISLICRFYDVNQGAIRIDGVDIRKIRQNDLRSQIGVVLQDTFLFNGTIAENIGYAKPGASREELMSAAKAANAHDFIISKTDGYDTRVGERGQSLSGGERQRIAIARAILHNPRILILDEATASVDSDTEKQIQEAITRMIRGRTTFAIAHRLSTLRNANRLVVLKAGEVAEMGTHQELLDRKGEFYRLVELQRETSDIMAVGK
ncbi:MAG: ABC transporter ATP-binding protein [bacterium]